MWRPKAREQTDLMRKHLTGPWDAFTLERVCGLEFNALRPQYAPAKARVQEFLRDTMSNNWPRVRFDPLGFVAFLTEVHDAQAERDALYDDKYGARAHMGKNRPNMGVLRRAIRVQQALELHLRVHALLTWNDRGDGEPVVCSATMDDLMNACDIIGPEHRKALLSVLRIGGDDVCDAVVLELGRAFPDRCPDLTFAPF